MVEAPGGIFVGLGSNLGDRAAIIARALSLLDASGVRVLRCSSLHETVPQGGPAGQGPYLNAVAEMATALRPHELLEVLLDVERRCGRTRGERNAPRTLDLDLLLYRDERIDEPGLTVPHPRMWERSFVLRPLEELCGAARVEALRRRFGPAREADEARAR